MASIPQLTPHSVAVDHNASLRLCGGLFLAVAWLASSAAQAQTTNYALGTTALVVGPGAGANSIVIEVTPQTATWTATVNAPWLHLNAANQSGTGSTNVVFTYDANPGATRSGMLTIAGLTLTITQAGSTYVAAGSLTSLAPSGLTSSTGVAVDSAGNVYIAAGNAVKKWTAANNAVTILVSSGLNNPYGVAVDGAGNVYIADTGNSAIKEWTAANSNVTTLVSSGLNKPYGVAVDSASNVYISDTGNNALKEWTAANSNVTTLVSSGLNAPYGLAVDGAGNVYIADRNNDAIKEWTVANSNVTTLAYSGLVAPRDVAVDGAGNVYIGDTAQTGNGYLLKILPYAFVDPTWRLESDAGGSDALPVVLPASEDLLPPFAPTSDQSWLTISGITNGVLSFSFTANTGPNRAAHITLLGQTIPVTQGGIVYSLGTTALVVGPATGTNSVVLGVTPQTGNWTAAANDTWLHLNAANQSGTGSTNVIFSYDANSGATRSSTLTIGDQTVTITQAGSTYVAVGALTVSSLLGGWGVAVDAAGNIYIANDRSIQKWTAANNSLTTLVSSGLSHPAGVAVDGVGNVYIADSNNGILKWTAANSNLTTLVSSGLHGPGAVAVDGAGNVYISDTGNGSIKEWSAVDHTVTTLPLNLGIANGVAVDGAGNVYAADGANRIQKWTVANNTVSILVSSGLSFPSGVAVDGAGNVYIADWGHNSIKKWTAANNTVTALASGLFYSTDVAVDGAGNVYIVYESSLRELPHAFVDPTPKLESLAAGSDALPVVLPATVNLLPPFAPMSDQSWLSITGVSNGVVSFAFSDNAGAARTVHLTLLGQTNSITQGVVGTPPVLTGMQMMSNGVLQFVFTNNPSAAFTVISTTNPSLPLSDWTVVGTPSNTAPGMFQFTSQPTTNHPQIFYSVRSPY